MTIRLFDEAPYIAQFSANVVKVVDSNIVLDRTAFYPESGGQSGDKGSINGLEVLDTVIIDGEILHVMSEAHGLTTRQMVDCSLNWDFRYNTMKIHSASHVMEYFLYKHFGVLERLGSNVDHKKDRSDYRTDERLDPVKLNQTEDEINTFLSEGHDIITTDEDGIRKWQCGPITEHCGGTHVKNTSEIGSISLKRRSPGRGKERVETSLKP